MVKITRLNNVEQIINSDLIEFIDATPDTNITMTTGRKVMVRESVDEVIDMVVAYKKRIFAIDDHSRFHRS
jgi:flagellar protein FlbD